MSVLVAAGSVALVAALASLIALGASTLRTRPVAIQRNLTRGLSVPDEHKAVAVPGGGLGRLILPAGMVRWLDRLLGAAGRPASWPLNRVLNAKLVGLVLGALLGFILFTALSGAASLVALVGVPAFGFHLPDLLLYNAAQKRREAITLELPETLDQLSIAVEAGLGFDAAMLRVARNGRGPLSQELVRTLQDIQVGQSRRDAYLALATRADVPPLRRFLRSVVQAEEYGIALADVLFTQAKEMRMERRQNAETKAMKIPVKVVFPLALCILPALFIVILGPAVISVIQVLGK